MVCTSFDARLLITPVVFSNLWSLCFVSFFWCIASDNFFGIFKPLIIVLLVLLLMHGFWLLILYFQTFDHGVPCPSFDARLLITPFVFSNLWSLCCLSFLWCTASDYFFGIFKPLIIVWFVLPLKYGFWLPLWFLQTLCHSVVCPSFDVRLLILLMYGFWLPLWYLQTFCHWVVCPSFDVRLLITPLVFWNLWLMCWLFLFDLRLLTFDIFKRLTLMLFALVWFTACGTYVASVWIFHSWLPIRLSLTFIWYSLYFF